MQSERVLLLLWMSSTMDETIKSSRDYVGDRATQSPSFFQTIGTIFVFAFWCSIMLLSFSRGPYH